MCDRLQPVKPVDYFERMGSPKRFDIDPIKLEKRYKALQWKLHPDRYPAATEEEQHIAAQQSASVNEAYQVLRKPESRASYLLHLLGIDISETGETICDPEILMEAMESREAVDSAQDQVELKEIQADIQERIRGCTQDLAVSFKEGNLVKAKRLAVRLSYLSKISDVLYEKIS